ncbi:MAG TPA: GNAT family N-acetyltransferase [Lachnospiraceae bacterium]|nr:GNAT family N-acetyltransferase [Lachnospiraceae bacterium]
MDYRIMTEEDIERVIPIYIDYYNNHEDCSWTNETAFKRIHQYWSMEGAYCFIVEDNGKIAGFELGYFEQYDDLVAYDINEIVIEYTYQNKGVGTAFLLEIEKQVKEKGSPMIQLTEINDEMHEHFYGKLQYQNVGSQKLKVKWL